VSTLRSRLGRRIAVLAALAAVAVAAGVVGYYTIDQAWLIHRTMTAQSLRIATTLAAGGNPAAEAIYAIRPPAYGFIVYDHRLPDHRRELASANPQMLQPVLGIDNTAGPDPLAQGESFLTRRAPNRGSDAEQWIMTDRVQVGPRRFWVVTVMDGDPAWTVVPVLLAELRDHAALPVLLVIPVLALLIWLVVRHGVRPLEPLAGAVEALGAAAAEGRPLGRLPEAGTPGEPARIAAATNAMLDKMEATLARHRQFAADAAHELRTPLAILALEAADLPAGAPAEHIRAEIGGLRTLLDQLLRFTEAESLTDADFRSFDLREPTRRACEALAPRAAAVDQAVTLDMPEAPVAVRGHPGLVEVALRNLLDNAHIASGPGGAVSVTVTPEGTVMVQDTGPGVAASERDIVFARRRRGRDAAPGGSGIGLALVARVMQAHGGAAEVMNAPQGGARFLLRFPLAERAS
jgi:two-component system OmpR family sensor kinase